MLCPLAFPALVAPLQAAAPFLELLQFSIPIVNHGKQAKLSESRLRTKKAMQRHPANVDEAPVIVASDYTQTLRTTCRFSFSFTLFTLKYTSYPFCVTYSLRRPSDLSGWISHTFSSSSADLLVYHSATRQRIANPVSLLLLSIPFPKLIKEPISVLVAIVVVGIIANLAKALAPLVVLR